MRKRNGAIGFLIVLAAIGISAVTRSPHFESIRNVDLLQLVASGVCLGVAATLVLRKSSV